MKLPLLALFLLLLLTACAFSAPEPIPNIPATVTAEIQAQLASIPTAVPPPTARPTPYPTQTQVPKRPTATPYLTPTPTPRPTPVPAASIAIMVEQVKGGVVRIETLDGSGSGVIFETTTQGALVVTNYHVIAESSQVEVVVAGETYQATLLGYDAHKDLAVLEICCGQFQALVIRDAKDIARPGTEVLAIGYALGLDGEASVTRGIVSGVRYNAKHSGWVIQIDAPINPGNSGGPLLLSSGEVIGINSYIFYEDAGRVLTEGVGFALAGQTVNVALDELKSGTRIALPTPTPPTPTPNPRVTTGKWKTWEEVQELQLDGDRHGEPRIVLIGASASDRWALQYDCKLVNGRLTSILYVTEADLFALYPPLPFSERPKKRISYTIDGQAFPSSFWIQDGYNPRFPKLKFWHAPDSVRNRIVATFLREDSQTIVFDFPGTQVKFNVIGFYKASEPVRSACRVR